MTPISLLMAMMDTSAVSSRMAACTRAVEHVRSATGQRRAHLQLREVHEAVGLHREVGDVPPRLLQVAARVQHALVVRLACDNVTLVTIKLRDALDGHVVALGGSLRGAIVSGAGAALGARVATRTDVKMISLASAPMRSATRLRARSTASSLCQPYRCVRLCGLPNCSTKNGSMASRTRGSTGVVAYSADSSQARRRWRALAVAPSRWRREQAPAVRACMSRYNGLPVMDTPFISTGRGSSSAGATSGAAEKPRATPCAACTYAPLACDSRRASDACTPRFAATRPSRRDARVAARAAGSEAPAAADAAHLGRH